MSKFFKNIFYYFNVILFLLFILVPIFWCATISLSFEKDIFSNREVFFPKNLNFSNYITLLSFSTKEGINFYLALKNSLITSLITIFLGVPISIFTGYTFARFKEKFILKYSLVFLSTIILPVFTTIIPLYTIFAKYNLLNNLFWLSIVYLSSFLPMLSWISLNYFKDFPIEIEEMGLIDGCDNFKVLIYIVLPNILPLIVTSIIVILLKTWSQYQLPLILSSARNVKPLTVLIAEFSSKDLILYGQIAAAGILAIIPPTIFTFIFRKYLISGLTQGSH